MMLKVTGIADRGDRVKERVVMRAMIDTDVGDYAVFRSKLLEEGAVSSDTTDAFWFPDKFVNAKDLVVLYTKAGTASERVLKSGRTVHFYYWGKSAALWAGSDHVPVLVHASNWEAFTDFVS